MNPEQCTNPSRPCGLHDPKREWVIEWRHTTVHSGWFVAGLIAVIIIATWFDAL